MSTPEADASRRPRIRIVYCTQCNWLLRANWMAAEILNTFGTDIGEVTLVPATGGVFRIEVDDTLAWERARDGGFPDVVTLKRLVRDIALPEWNLGHGEPRTSMSAHDTTS